MPALLEPDTPAKRRQRELEQTVYQLIGFAPNPGERKNVDPSGAEAALEGLKAIALLTRRGALLEPELERAVLRTLCAAGEEAFVREHFSHVVAIQPENAGG